MGYTRHNAVIVTYWDKERLELERDRALDLGLQATEIVESPVNGYCSFFIAPDGSKEGWDTSMEYDEKRKKFCSGIQVYIDCVDIEYGGDAPDQVYYETYYHEEPESAA
jgi:hypothetical protein